MFVNKCTTTTTTLEQSSFQNKIAKTMAIKKLDNVELSSTELFKSHNCLLSILGSLLFSRPEDLSHVQCLPMGEMAGKGTRPSFSYYKMSTLGIIAYQ